MQAITPTDSRSFTFIGRLAVRRTSLLYSDNEIGSEFTVTISQ